MDRDNLGNGIVVSSHQGHFFPWLGYLDKMARSNIFLLNDVCQIELKSPMMRNKVLDINGDWHYFNLSVVRDHYRSMENRHIKLRCWSEDRKKIEGLLRMCYGSLEYWGEIWKDMEEVFSQDYVYIVDAQIASLQYLRKCFDIHTKIIRHSSLNFQATESKSINIVEKMKIVGASTYLSGNGAKKYIEKDVFEKNGIKLEFQNFIHPVYPQKLLNRFVGNMSAIDMLFYCGKRKAKEIFWDNIEKEMSA